jgi:hypothetical protein
MAFVVSLVPKIGKIADISTIIEHYFWGESKPSEYSNYIKAFAYLVKDRERVNGYFPWRRLISVMYLFDERYQSEEFSYIRELYEQYKKYNISLDVFILCWQIAVAEIGWRNHHIIKIDNILDNHIKCIS